MAEQAKTASTTRKLYPIEIESEQEKHHELKKYKDIKLQLQEIRELHLDGVLFEACKASDNLMEYIKNEYPNSGLYEKYGKHPQRKLLMKQLKETNRMLNFLKSSQNWTVYQDDGIWKTEWASSNDSDFESFRISGFCDVSLVNILAVLYEMDLLIKWMPLCKESLDFGNLSLYSKVGYIRIGLFWPIVDREFILNGYGGYYTKYGNSKVNKNIIKCLEYLLKVKPLKLKYVKLFHRNEMEYCKEVEKSKSMRKGFECNKNDSLQICKLLIQLLTIEVLNIKTIELYPIVLRTKEIEYLEFWFSGIFGLIEKHIYCTKFSVVNLMDMTIVNTQHKQILSTNCVTFDSQVFSS
eukprot:252240_1